MEWSLSVTNLPLWLRDWLKNGLFHQLTLSCALTLSDNRLLDLLMVLFPDWTQQPSRCRPYWLSRCRAAKGNEKRPFRVITLDVLFFFFLSFQTITQVTLYIKEQTHHLNTSVIYCSWKGNTQKPWQCICPNREQMDSHSWHQR